MITCHDHEIQYWPEDGCRLCNAQAEIARLQALISRLRKNLVGNQAAARKRRMEVKGQARQISKLQAQLAEWQASQTYRYIGRNGQPVLARDLEDRAERAEAQLAAEKALADRLYAARMGDLAERCSAGLAYRKARGL